MRPYDIDVGKGVELVIGNPHTHTVGAFGIKLKCPSCDTSRAIAHALWRL